MPLWYRMFGKRKALCVHDDVNDGMCFTAEGS